MAGTEPSGTAPHGEPQTSAVTAALRVGSRRAAQRVALLFSSKGPSFRKLAESHAGSVGGDTLVALALAGTLFFDVPSTDEARQNVALYLLITLAPFAVIGPFLGRIFERFPAAYRGGLAISGGARVVIAAVMLFGLDNIWLFPLAFLLLVMSRFHGISRSSVLPVVLDDPAELIVANAQLARIGVLASAVVAPLGGIALWLDAPWLALLGAVVVFAWSTYASTGLPPLSVPHRAPQGSGGPSAPPRPVRLARFATAGVRFLNGFLLLLVAFAFRDVDAGILDFSTLLGAGGIGYFLAALITPTLDRYISEEPMVVTALAIEAGSAFIAAMIFGLPAAAALAAAAGLAWGTAKFAFDGLLQATVPGQHRGRAFTNSETLFQFAWVLGALIPVVPLLDVEFGLAMAGIAALVIQVLYVSAVLVPVAAARRSAGSQQPQPAVTDVMDLL
jgi:hypothetical protein